ncbi:MAG: metal ABC transporter permease [Dehalococcoidia bacterium]|nr:metal ABC transporter permease [Dehalococcoidia bacterium]MDD5647520.1 metal ABC transporter permease [Dehalococcoidia bacterium]
MFEAFQFEFMRNALLAGLLASIACGIVGVYVVVKKIVSMSGGIAHASFGGIGLGYLLNFSPVLGAMFFSLLSALTMGLVTRRTRLPEDTAIGILWALGMALGVIFIGFSKGYAPDLMSYLFGNILTVPLSDLYLMAALDLVILVLTAVFYKEFLLLSFDEEFGTVAGMPVNALYLVLLCMVALTVVVLIRVVGMILVIAMLAFPAAMARQFTHDIKKMMILSVILGMIFTFGGLWISYILNLASGATIILLSGLALLATYIVTGLRHRMKVRFTP